MVSSAAAKTAESRPIAIVSAAPLPRSGKNAPCASNCGSHAEFKFAHGGARPGAGRKPKSVPPSAAPDGAERWYCVRTCHGRELTADIEIRRAGFIVFAPTVWKAATPERRGARGTVRPARPDRIEPLFRRYLFVRFRRASHAWVAIRALPGVECIVGPAADAPRPVPDAVIAAIRGLCAPNGCIYPDNATLGALAESPPVRPAPIAAGTVVTLASGPFAGLAGICAWSDGKRVRVLLEIMGRSVPVPMAQAGVEAA